MKNFLKAWRQAKVFNNNYGGAYVFWDEYFYPRAAWRAVPNPRTPYYETMFEIIQPEFFNYYKEPK